MVLKGDYKKVRREFCLEREHIYAFSKDVHGRARYEPRKLTEPIPINWGNEHMQ